MTLFSLESFFSFKIILLFNIIDFLKQKLSMTKIMYMYVLEARCITLHSRSEIYRDGLNRCWKKAKAWVHASLGSAQKRQIYPFNFRIYQIFLSCLIRIVFAILFDQVENKIQFCLLNFTTNQKYLIGHRIKLRMFVKQFQFTPFSFKIVRHLTID